jgi:hypothetical protein
MLRPTDPRDARDIDEPSRLNDSIFLLFSAERLTSGVVARNNLFRCQLKKTVAP